MAFEDRQRVGLLRGPEFEDLAQGLFFLLQHLLFGTAAHRARSRAGMTISDVEGSHDLADIFQLAFERSDTEKMFV